MNPELFTELELLISRQLETITRWMEEKHANERELLLKELQEAKSSGVPKCYALEEVSELIRVDVRTIYRMRKDHQIPYIRIGSKVMIWEKDLIDFLKRHRVAAARE